MKITTMNIYAKLGFNVQVENNLSADYIDIYLPTKDGRKLIYREQKHLLSGDVKKARLPLSKIVKLYVLG